jgi:hypothetical protein
VNKWVVGDDWLGADGTIALLPRFDVQMPPPSYLVNRWLTAIFTAYEREITELIRERDRALLTHRQPEGVEARQDRALEVTSELEPSDCRCSRPLRPMRGGGISAAPGRISSGNPDRPVGRHVAGACGGHRHHRSGCGCRRRGG